MTTQINGYWSTYFKRSIDNGIAFDKTAICPFCDNYSLTYSPYTPIKEYKCSSCKAFGIPRRVVTFGNKRWLDIRRAEMPI